MDDFFPGAKNEKIKGKKKKKRMKTKASFF